MQPRLASYEDCLVATAAAETVANFDETHSLGEGKIIYSGPVNEVIDLILSYEIPERMDAADCPRC
jgi:hypothetical protein